MTDDWLHQLIESAYKAAHESPIAARQLEACLRKEIVGKRLYVTEAAPTFRSDQPLHGSTDFLT